MPRVPGGWGEGMKRETLADRIVTYCDALVAFSLVNGLAFVVALAEPDIRCSIVGIAAFVATVNAVIPVVSTLTLIWLRRYELELRRDAEGEAVEDALVDRFWTIVSKVRFALIWFFAAVVVFGVLAATQDPSCAQNCARELR
jgi:hypothetical protein